MEHKYFHTDSVLWALMGSNLGEKDCFTFIPYIIYSVHRNKLPLSATKFYSWTFH